jgi:hypothetical protein
MKNLCLILLFVYSIINAQPFTYSGLVLGPNEQGIPNIPVSLYGKRTDPYDVTYPNYPANANYTQGTAIPSSDDVTHGPFNIGFSFTYFGNTYTQFYVGSNGWIGFSPNQTSGYVAAYIPNASSPMNTILGDWEDLYPGNANIFYTTLGTAPNRSLVVSFNQVPHYGCRSNLHTFQFIIYETTGVIDINYASKPLCGGYNATAGLVNADNSNVVPAGGKNASAWSVTNHSIRFTPSAPEVTFSLKGVYLTNAQGIFTVVPNLDAQSYQFEIRIESLPITSLTFTQAQYPSQMLLNSTALNSKLYYQMDINNDGHISISDSYLLNGRASGRFAAWPNSPDYRLFNSTQWSVIKNGSTNLKTTYPGVQTLTISPINGGTATIYLLRTGYSD